MSVAWARHDDEVREAQHLRWRVFAQEMGALLRPPADAPLRHDVDAYDDHCEHLLVRASNGDDDPPLVIGTYRVLMPSAARELGYYSEREFDLSNLRALQPSMAELGRSCVDAQWRTGGAILLLWASLGEFMERHAIQTVIGCASIPARDGGGAAAALWRELQRTHLAREQWRVTPRHALSLPGTAEPLGAECPPLIKGYLRCNGRVLGAPAWDADFRTADLPMMLRLEELPAAYRRRFMSGAVAAV